MTYFTLTPHDGGVFVLEFTQPEARISVPFINEFHKHLDVVEKNEGATAMILTNKGKFFSNGLSFEALAEDPASLLSNFYKLTARLVAFCVPTIAAVNGHAFAGGAFMALCCDYRVMNSEKGFLCVNEVELNMPLTPGLMAMATHKVDRSQWTRMVLDAHRFSGKEALASGIAHMAVPEAEVRATALKLAAKVASRGANKGNYHVIKSEMFKVAINEMLHGKNNTPKL